MSDLQVFPKHTITFDQELRPWILKVFGLYVGNDSIIYHEKTGEQALAINGSTVRVEHFAGVIKTDKGLRIVCDGVMGALDMANEFDLREHDLP
jgi:hypothetical protein